MQEARCLYLLDEKIKQTWHSLVTKTGRAMKKLFLSEKKHDWDREILHKAIYVHLRKRKHFSLTQNFFFCWNFWFQFLILPLNINKKIESEDLLTQRTGISSHRYQYFYLSVLPNLDLLGLTPVTRSRAATHQHWVIITLCTLCCIFC